MNNIYAKDWEQRLERKLFLRDRSLKRAYICSPLRGESEEETFCNMRRARAYMYYAVERMGYIAKAPHAYLPVLLCDEFSEERELALWFGLKLLQTCDVLLVCGNRISDGMRGEIAEAARRHMPIITFHEEIYRDVLAVVRDSKGDVDKVSLDLRHFSLVQSDPTIYQEQQESSASE